MGRERGYAYSECYKGRVEVRFFSLFSCGCIIVFGFVLSCSDFGIRFWRGVFWFYG